MRNLWVNGLAVILGVGSLAMNTANAEALKADLKVFKLEAKSKKELKSTDQIKPKALLEYQVNYANVSKNSLKGLKLNLPIPTDMTYTGTSSPQNTLASTDGVNFAKAPLSRMVEGKKVMVPLSEYRALQWHVAELKPKQTISVTAQVRVNSAD